jgi:hypothetical protein
MTRPWRMLGNAFSRGRRTAQPLREICPSVSAARSIRYVIGFAFLANGNLRRRRESAQLLTAAGPPEELQVRLRAAVEAVPARVSCRHQTGRGS